MALQSRTVQSVVQKAAGEGLQLSILFFFILLFTADSTESLSPVSLPPPPKLPAANALRSPAWRYETPSKDFLSRSKLGRLSSLTRARGQRCRRRTRSGIKVKTRASVRVPAYPYYEVTPALSQVWKKLMDKTA